MWIITFPIIQAASVIKWAGKPLIAVAIAADVYEMYQTENKPRTATDYEEPTNKASKQAWARLIQKVYEVNPLICPNLVLFSLFNYSNAIKINNNFFNQR